MKNTKKGDIFFEISPFLLYWYHKITQQEWLQSWMHSYSIHLQPCMSQLTQQGHKF